MRSRIVRRSTRALAVAAMLVAGFGVAAAVADQLRPPADGTPVTLRLTPDASVAFGALTCPSPEAVMITEPDYATGARRYSTAREAVTEFVSHSTAFARLPLPALVAGPAKAAEQQFALLSNLGTDLIIDVRQVRETVESTPDTFPNGSPVIDPSNAIAGWRIVQVSGCQHLIENGGLQ